MSKKILVTKKRKTSEERLIQLIPLVGKGGSVERPKILNPPVRIIKNLVRKRLRGEKTALCQAKSLSLEQKFIVDLETAVLGKEVSHDHLEIYANAFSELIKINHAESGLLCRIKFAYDQYVAKKETENLQLRQEIKVLQEQFNEEKAGYKQINKRFKKLAFDNVLMNEEISKYMQQVGSLKDKLCKKKDDAMKDDIRKAFDILKGKLEETTNKLNEMQNRCRKQKINELRLQKTMNVMRNKGYPIDEVLQNEVDPQQNRMLWLEVPSRFSLTSSNANSNLLSSSSIVLPERQISKSKSFESNGESVNFSDILHVISSRKISL